MAQLRDKVQNALDETRMLILCSEVLLGFQFRSIFEVGYEKLPAHSRYLMLFSLGLMTIAVGLLMWPAAYHRIVHKGEDAEDMHRFTSEVMDWALLPFAVALGIDLFVATERLAGIAWGAAGGVAGTATALLFWYGIEMIDKTKREAKIMREQEADQRLESGKTELTDKIKHVLTETRVVLPGAQALVGFQFATILMESFEGLPPSSKYVHLLSLAMVTLTVVLLMTPAAYHRIVERGEETEHFHRFAGRMLLAAMVPLALGLAGDLFVVTRKVTGSTGFALSAAAITLALFYTAWFGLTTYKRSRREGRTLTN